MPTAPKASAPPPPSSGLLARTKRRRDAPGAAPASAAGAAAGAARAAGLYHCNYCDRDLSHSLRVRCAACRDFDLCLTCFAAGAEVAPHASDHPYTIADPLAFPVYEPGWAAAEEVLLLEAVAAHGLGAWAAVGTAVGRPPAECQAHYYGVYVDHARFPDPPAPLAAGAPRAQPAAAGRAAAARAAAAAEKAAAEKAAAAAAAAAALAVKAESGEPAAKRQRPPAAAAAASGAGPAESTPAAPHAAAAGKSPATGGAAAAGDGGTPAALLAAEAVQTGYNARRDEFEPEYDADAESIVAELSFAPGEPPEETARKLRLIDIYNRRLDARAARREWIKARGLLNVRASAAADRRRAPRERELHGRLRVLARHLPPEQFEALADGLAAEARLRARVAELQEFRAAGLRTFEAVDAWEASAAGRARRREMPPGPQANKPKSQRLALDEAGLQAALASPGLGAPHAAAALGAHRALLADGRGAGLQPWRARRGALLDVTVHPDAAPLAPAELRLCAADRYLPAQYLAVKAAALAAAAERGGALSADALRAAPLAARIDPARAGRLHEFLVAEGYIRAPPAPAP